MKPIVVLLAVIVGALPFAFTNRTLASGDPSVRIQSTLIDGRFARMEDTQGGRLICDRSTWHSFWTPGINPHFPPQEPSFDMISRPDGFDLVVTFDNRSGEMRSLGVIYLPGLKFPQVIQTRDFYVDGKPKTTDRGTAGTYFGGGNIYPGSIYSPVALLGDGEYTVGVSLLYPILEYKHRVWIRTEGPDFAESPTGRDWQVRFELNPTWNLPYNDLYSNEGDLHPGEHREYRMCVRVMHREPDQHPAEWLRLFEPYRLYFAHKYGAVAYQRDARPVQGITIGYPGDIGEHNPYGFVGGATRPDIHGWGPWTDRMRQSNAQGWERFMLWAPSGLFDDEASRVNNYPFQFTSGWNRVPMIRETLPLLGDFAAEGHQLGLWWGHSANYQKEWNPHDSPIINIHDPEQLGAALTELDGAAMVGTTMVGLDTFTRIPEWDSIPYLEMLHHRYPNMKFLVEPMPSDILHRVAAGYILATRPQGETGFRVENPHYLADFINPGHELWGGVHENDIRGELGMGNREVLSRDRILSVLQRYTRMGYVVAPYTAISVNPDAHSLLAVESWRTSVPPVRGQPAEPRPIASPRPATALPGDSVTLQAAFSGSDLSYRWRKDGEPLVNGENINGSDTPQLVITPVLGHDEGTYDCVAENFLGSRVSAPAPVTVGCVTDFNHDGTVNSDDLGDFILAFFASEPRDPRCDIDGDSNINADDLGYFITVFFLGC